MNITTSLIKHVEKLPIHPLTITRLITMIDTDSKLSKITTPRVNELVFILQKYTHATSTRKRNKFLQNILTQTYLHWCNRYSNGKDNLDQYKYPPHLRILLHTEREKYNDLIKQWPVERHNELTDKSFPTLRDLWIRHSNSNSNSHNNNNNNKNSQLDPATLVKETLRRGSMGFESKSQTIPIEHTPLFPILIQCLQVNRLYNEAFLPIVEIPLAINNQQISMKRTHNCILNKINQCKQLLLVKYPPFYSLTLFNEINQILIDEMSTRFIKKLYGHCFHTVYTAAKQ